MSVAVAPFPWGGILPGGTFTIEAFAFATAGLAFLTRDRDVGRSAAAPIALIAVAVLGVFQLVPMQPETLRRVSPMSARIYDEANSILRLFDRPAVAPRISIAPTETESTILLTLAYAALFTAGAILSNTRIRRRWLIAVLFATSTIHVLVSAMITGASDRMHGAFVNPNHLAGYLEVALAFAFGTIWAEVLTGVDRTSGSRDRGERLEKRALPFVWRILLWGVIAAGIGLTRSRGGTIAAVITSVALIAFGFARRRRSVLITISAILLGVLFVVFTTGETSLIRILGSDPRDINTDTRVLIWKSSIDAWRLFPHFGSGLGAFKEAFRRVQPREIEGMVEQAHNDFLQLLVTGGWVGAALGTVAFLSVFVVLSRAWFRQSHREESAFILAALGALFCLTIHGLVEFNMSLPAIPATLAVMLGSAHAAARA